LRPTDGLCHNKRRLHGASWNMGIPKAFISYSWDTEAHKEWVRSLASQLRKDGVDVTLDQWHVQPGDQLPIFMEGAVRDNDFVLIICTPNYKEKSEGRRGGVGYEGDIIQGEAFVMHNHRKFVPILRSGNWPNAAPSQLFGKAYINLSPGTQYQEQYSALLRALHGRRLTPPEIGTPPNFAGERDRLEPLYVHAPVFLVPYRPSAFVGRQQYLAHLQSALTVEPGLFVLYGAPGIGKSALSLSFAWEAQKYYDAVIFQRCGSRSVDAIAAELIERLPEVRQYALVQQRAALKEWLSSRRSLLILDDVWSSDVRQLEPGPSCSVLYTSRYQSLAGIPPARSTKLERLTDQECGQLFHAYLDPVFGEHEVTKNQSELSDFSSRVEGLPIAVAVSASLLLQNQALTLPAALAKLRTDALADGEVDVNLLLSRAIESQPEDAQRLLAACAICGREELWLPLAIQVSGLHETVAEEAANRLVHASLIHVADRNRHRFHLHSLLRGQTRHWIGKEQVALLRGRHSAAVEQIFERPRVHHSDYSQCMDDFFQAVCHLVNIGENARASTLVQRAQNLGIALVFDEDTVWAVNLSHSSKDAAMLRLTLDDSEMEHFLRVLLSMPRFDDVRAQLEELS
jgi:hypothetical protein